MNYRHIYHAGSFSDLIKHITLVAVLNSLKKKEKPFAVLDAFAGLGVYDLKSEQASKTEESNDGIVRVLGGSNDNPLLAQFVDMVKNLNSGVIARSVQHDVAISEHRSTASWDCRASLAVTLEDRLTTTTEVPLRYYPGSPWIINNMLRPSDRLIASELHPQDYEHLRHLFFRSKQVAVHLLDAYNAVKAFIPFKENRGLVFLDPPFEEKNEFDKLIGSLKIINQRAANICSMIWYPIKDNKTAQSFYKNCQEVGFKEILIIEFEIKNPQRLPSKHAGKELTSSAVELRKVAGPGMTKCGILITNPPFIHQEIKGLLEYLKKHTYQNQAEFNVYCPSVS